MSFPLLATKFYVPPVRPQRVLRPRLIERLRAEADRKLTLVSAPAGFGKTTLVADWLAGLQSAYTWLTLDDGDNDPSRFLRYLVAALQRIESALGQLAQDLQAAPQPPPVELVMTLLINDIAAMPQPERTTGLGSASQPSMMTDLREAVGFLRDWPGITIVIGIAAVVNLLLFPALSLQPLLVTEHFGGDAVHLAWLQSAFGVGMVAGGITLSVWGGSRRRALTGLLALALSGAGFALVGLVPARSFPLAVGAMFFAWFMNPIANGSLMAVLQIVVPPDMQGRVFTLLQSAAGVMVPLGLLVAAPLADALGVRAWFLIAGIAVIVLGLAGLFVPAIMQMEEQAGINDAGIAGADDQLAFSVGTQ